MAGVGANVLVGTPQDTGATNAGAAYLFDASTGALLRTFLNPSPAAGDEFGWSVAALGGNALVGAFGDDTGATDAGAAYLFDANTGTLLHTFLNPTPVAGDWFGYSVAGVGSNVLVGAPFDDTGATNTGAAYLFDASSGALLQTFLNPTPAAFDHFGVSVAGLGGNVLVGAWSDDTGAENAGAAYLFGQQAPPIPNFRLPWRFDQEGIGWRLGTAGLHYGTPLEPDQKAIDFIHESQVGRGCGIDTSIDVTSVASGLVIEASNASHQVQVQHSNGWTSVYFHLANIPEELLGQNVPVNTRLGNPSCLGAVPQIVSHVHFAMKGFGGTWSQMVGEVELCGWRIQGDTDDDGVAEFVRGSSIPPINVNNGSANIPCARGVTIEDRLIFPGQTVETQVTMPAGQALSTMAAFWGGSTVDLTLVAPDGTAVGPTTSDPAIFHSKGDTFELYDISSPQPGQWTVRLYGADVSAAGEPVQAYFMSCAAPPGLGGGGGPCSLGVGGIAELPEVAGTLEAGSSSGSNAGVLAGIAAGAAAGAVALGGAFWCAKRRAR